MRFLAGFLCGVLVVTWVIGEAAKAGRITLNDEPQAKS